MHANDKKLCLLKYLKKNNGILDSKLQRRVEPCLEIKDYNSFIHHLEDEGYLRYDQNTRCYYIMKKGSRFVVGQNILQFSKNPIVLIILTLIAAVAALKVIWNEIIKLF